MFLIESHAAPGLPSVIALIIKKARATRSRIPSKENTAWNSQKARPMPKGKISGNPIGMI